MISEKGSPRVSTPALLPPTPCGGVGPIGARISYSSRAEDWMPAYAGMTKGASFPRKRESSTPLWSTTWAVEPLNLALMGAGGGVAWSGGVAWGAAGGAGCPGATRCQSVVRQDLRKKLFGHT